MELFHSNCLVEAIKAKIKNPSIKLLFISAHRNEVFFPHVMWTDGIVEHDFGIEQYIPPLKRFWYKGYIRTHKIGTYKRCLERKEKRQCQMK